MTRHLLEVGIMLPAGLPESTMVSVAAMTGRLGFSTVQLAEVPASRLLEALVEAAAPALVVVELPAADPGSPTAGIVRVNDPQVVAAERSRLDAEGTKRPLRVTVAISIGRTMSEAQARAGLEPRFAGDRHPQAAGIFGTFEQAQEQVLALARAGAEELLLDIPLGWDVADVLAQIRALVVGATPELVDAPAHPDRTVPPRTVFYGS